MKKLVMMVIIVMVMVSIIGCGKKTEQQTAYVRAYDEETGETLGYICEVDGQIYIMANHEKTDELVDMVKEELESIKVEMR